MTLIIVGVVVYGIMVALFWLFLRGASILNKEEELCNKPMAECSKCHKC